MIENLPIDATDLIADAYGIQRRPRYRVIPQTVGLATALLVAQNVTRRQAIGIGRPRRHPAVDAALCEAAEAFALVLGFESPAGWRGGALASLSSLLGSGLLVESHMFWVTEDRARRDVRDWAAGVAPAGLFPSAFDVLTANLLSHRPLMASWDCIHERTGVTRELRCDLQGHDFRAHRDVRHPGCFPDVPVPQ